MARTTSRLTPILQLRAAALRFLVAHAAEVTSTPGWEALAASQQPALLETMVRATDTALPRRTF